MKKLVGILMSVFAVVAGIIFVISGIKTIADKDLYDTPVTATVVDVQEELETATDPDDTDRLVKTAYIDYEVNGKKYEHVLAPEQDESLKVGDTVEILCQSKDPSKISGKNPAKGGAIFIALGAAVAICGGFSAFRLFVRKN